MEKIKVLLRQYLSVLHQAWQNRHTWQSKSHQRDELAFLPATVELLHSPPSPVARLSTYVLCTMVVLILLWSVFGKIDIVAAAPGKLIPSERSKTIQPMETATVRAIYVKEGMEVKKGQLLVALDPTLAAADKHKTQDALLHAHLTIARSEALLLALSRSELPQLIVPKEIDTIDNQVEVASAKRILASQWQEYQAKMATLETDVLRKRAEYEAARDQVTKLSQTLPIVTQRAQAYSRLTQENFVSKHHYLEKEQARIETAQDLASQRNRLKELQAAIQTNINQQKSHAALFEKEQNDQLNEAQKQRAQLIQEHIKTTQQHSHTRLIAPVDGVVQGLAIHTVGGVITPAQVVMHIVPKDDVLEIEAWVSNKDIGFITPGQRAAIKIETFQYTRYGLLEGVVSQVSSDAVNDEKRGLIYAAHIQLPRAYMWVDGKKVKLVPGMAVDVDIKIGQRRVIEYFLNPFIEYASESLRER
jgi:hemolysin D